MAKNIHFSKLIKGRVKQRRNLRLCSMLVLYPSVTAASQRDKTAVDVLGGGSWDYTRVRNRL